jgi:hypothetical protein
MVNVVASLDGTMMGFGGEEKCGSSFPTAESFSSSTIAMFGVDMTETH